MTQEAVRHRLPPSVTKRDGSVVSFDITRIANAVRRALEATREVPDDRISSVAMDVAAHVTARLSGDAPHVEEIQDKVEEALLAAGLLKTCRAYIYYRGQRRRVRRASQTAEAAAEIITKYIDQADWRVNENANMTFSLQGLNGHLSSTLVAHYWLHDVYPSEVTDAHLRGDIHIHDLGVLAPYCNGWDLWDLLVSGFTGVPGKVQSAPPRHFDVALGQIVNFLYTLQGEAAGAQAFSNFDTLLAPFVRADGLDYDEVKQCMQEFLFNMNVPTRVGFQTPFTNITLDLVPPAHMRGQPVIIGGEPQDTTYGEYQREMDMINRAFAELMLEGDASGRIFTFPIPTYNITEDFDWDNPVLEPIWEMTAKYGVPYFANFINSDMDPSDVRSMCCRLRLDGRELRRRLGGIFGSAPLTGSIGVVTINLLSLALDAADVDDFFVRLGRMMDLARTSLEIKRKTIQQLTEAGLYPYSRFYLRSVYQRTGSWWSNHFSTIGPIGAHEAIEVLLGRGIDTPEGAQLAEQVLNFMLERLDAYSKETGNLYNLEASPAEGASYRLALATRRRVEDGTTRRTYEVPEYLTNSTQLPAERNGDLLFALPHQERLQTKYTGGTVFHIFLGERLPSGEYAKTMIRKVLSRFRLPYVTLTPTFSICPVHGYLSGEHEFCPHEHSPEDIERYGVLHGPISGVALSEPRVPCEVYSRVVGYYRPVGQWNTGKRAEFVERGLAEPSPAAVGGD